jgi:hypothetical protein
VSEGHGLGEERLTGRRTEETKESGGTRQIPMDDGAAVLGSGGARESYEDVSSGRRRSAPLARAWMRGERAKKGHRVTVGAFEERLGGVGREEKGGSAWARLHGGGRRRRGGPSMVVSSIG